MIDRIMISAFMGVSGWHGLFPDTPQRLTPWQLQVKAKEASKSEVCKKKEQTETVKKLCRKWGKQQES